MLTFDTFLIDGLTQDESLLDRILALDVRFKKFHKVLNNERVANTLNLEDVAHMLDVPVDVLLAFANGKGPVEWSPIGTEQLISKAIDSEHATKTLDLRPLFENGIEPLPVVLDEISMLEPTDVLIVEAPFHPLPLRRLLNGRGFDSIAKQISTEHWQIAFTKKNMEPKRVNPN